MTDTAPLFPEIECELAVEVVPPAPNTCAYPMSILGYWPRGRYWKIHAPLEFDDAASPRLLALLKDLTERGWHHLHIMRLPAVGPWAEK